MLIICFSYSHILQGIFEEVLTSFLKRRIFHVYEIRFQIRKTQKENKLFLFQMILKLSNHQNMIYFFLSIIFILAKENLFTFNSPAITAIYPIDLLFQMTFELFPIDFIFWRQIESLISLTIISPLGNHATGGFICLTFGFDPAAVNRFSCIFQKCSICFSGFESLKWEMWTNFTLNVMKF